MTDYLAELRGIEKFLDGFEVWYVPRLDNCGIAHLAWIASSRAPTLLDIIIKKLSKPSIKPAEQDTEAAPDLMVIDDPEQEPVCDWMNPIKIFLENQSPSDDNVEVERIARKSKMYHLIDGILFR
jgi:hypothetical protein